MARIKLSVLGPAHEVLARLHPPPGIIVADTEVRSWFSEGGLSLLTVTIEFGVAVSASVVAKWLFDTFVKPNPTDCARQIKINEKVVTVVTENQFQQLIEREITDTKDNAPPK